MGVDISEVIRDQDEFIITEIKPRQRFPPLRRQSFQPVMVGITQVLIPMATAPTDDNDLDRRPGLTFVPPSRHRAPETAGVDRDLFAIVI